MNQNLTDFPDISAARKNPSAPFFIILSIALIFQSCSVAPRYVTKSHEEKRQTTPPPVKKTKPDEGKKGNSKEAKSSQIPSDQNEIPEKDSEPPAQNPDLIFQQTGLASYYANNLQGHKTANGERYDKRRLTAAHLTLPFNTKVKVTNISNNQSVIVRINDRGPHSKSRIIDLSRAAAEQIGLIRQGICQVRIELIE